MSDAPSGSEPSVPKIACGPSGRIYVVYQQKPEWRVYYRERYDSGGLYATSVNAAATPVASADFDNDGDVDPSDFALFQMCFNGPNQPPAVPGSCDSTDYDNDGDVDLNDFAMFQACSNGPNHPPACSGS